MTVRNLRAPARRAGRTNSHAAIRKALLAWYGESGRRFPWRARSAGLYRKVVAEVLLQRTQAGTVGRFFGAFVRQFPGWRALASASVEDIGEFLRPIGLWRRRASSLSALATEMVKRNGRFPSTREELEDLPGVGQYVASAVLLFSKGEAEPLLDANMARVLERIFGRRKLADIRFDADLQRLARQVVRGSNAKEINWSILDLAATVCILRQPRCVQCPVARWCLTAKNAGIKEATSPCDVALKPPDDLLARDEMQARRLRDSSRCHRKQSQAVRLGLQ